MVWFSVATLKTFWRLGDISFQISLKPCPLDLIGRFTVPCHISSFIFEKCLRLIIFHNLKSISQVDVSLSTHTHTHTHTHIYIYIIYIYLYIYKETERDRERAQTKQVWLDFHMQNLKHLYYEIPNFTFNNK